MAQLFSLGHLTTFTFMTLKQVGVLLCRLVSIYYFIAATLVLMDIPVIISEAFHSPNEDVASDHEFAAWMLAVRALIYLCAGISFLFFARPLARLFTKGLESIKHDDVV